MCADLTPQRVRRTRSIRFVRAAAWLAVTGGAVALLWSAWRWYGPSEPGSSSLARSRRPVVLITVDTTRADRLGAYGSTTGATPQLDRLADEGVLFSHAYAVAPITLVAHTSIMTGLEPPAHGVRNNGIHSVPDRVTTLAERLADAGYATGAFVSAAVLERRYRLDQGFAVYDDDLSAGRERHPRMVADRPAEAAVAAATSWLDTVPAGQPFFVWLHLYDPHAVYSPPPPYRDRFRDSLYDGEIAYMDEWIGRFLEHSRIDADTLVVVLGDHGESLGEHGEQTHALLAYDSTLHVPWIMRVPGGPEGLELEPTVSQVDLVPTLLDLLGLEVPSGLAGVSLTPLLEGRTVAARRPLYSETFLPFYSYGWAKLRVLRQGRMKWIDGPDPELYDTRRDPRELSNLVDQEPGLAHDLGRTLEERMAVWDDAGAENTLELDADARARLQALGYLAAVPTAEGTSSGVPAERADPKAMIDLHVGLERARMLVRDRLFEAAEVQLLAVLERDPTNLAAWIDLASARLEAGDVEAAAAAATRGLELDPASLRLHLVMASVEARRGHLGRALDVVAAALEHDPDSLEARLRRAMLLARAGRTGQAVEVLDRAVADGLDAPPVQVLLARYQDLPVNPGAAVRRVEAALAADPFLVSGWQLLGEALMAAGRPDAALAAWRSGLERRPDDAELHAQLGLALARRQAGAEARTHLEEAIRLATTMRPELHVTLGAALAESGQLEAARREYARVLEVEPDHPAARNNRAVALYQSGREAEAREEWLDLVRRHPHHADAHNNLAALALRAAQPAEAERHARRAVELAPEMAEAWSNLGLARAGGGDDGEAMACYRRSLELDPGYWQARLNLGMLLAERGPPRDAAEVLGRLVADVPGLVEAHLELGVLYAGELDDSERARAHLNAVLRRRPDHPRAAEIRRLLRELPPPVDSADRAQ